MFHRSRASKVVSSVLLMVLVGSPVSTIFAEELVMKDGSRLKTKGPYKVKGQQVLFTNAKGQLVAISLDDVDLPASEKGSKIGPKATELKTVPRLEDAEVKPQKLPIPDKSNSKKVVLVLTDKDIPKAAVDIVPTIDPTDFKVVMFSTSWCPACKTARAFFEQFGIPYTEYDIEQNPVAKRQAEAKSPGCGVPVIEVGERVFCGFGVDTLLKVLKLDKTKEVGKKEAKG